MTSWKIVSLIGTKVMVLKRYEIHPKQIRIGTDNKRGYDFNDMLDAFAKYLPEEEPPEYKQEEVELF